MGTAYCLEHNSNIKEKILILTYHLFLSNSRSIQVRDFLYRGRSLKTMIIHLITLIVRESGREFFDYELLPSLMTIANH